MQVTPTTIIACTAASGLFLTLINLQTSNPIQCDANRRHREPRRPNI